jgi:hypothetical protein
MEIKAATLEELKPRLESMNRRMAEWQRQVQEELARLMSAQKSAQGGHDHEEQHKVLRLAMARAGEGPRREWNALMDDMCNFYIAANDSRRVQIRQMMEESPALLSDLWGYAHRAAEQVRAGGGEQWLRFGLAVVSLEDLRGVYEDTLAGLADLYIAACETGINPEACFAEIAHLSSTDPHGNISCQHLLRHFENSSYFATQVKPCIQALPSPSAR